MKSLAFLSSRLTPLGLRRALICFIALVCLSLISATSWQMNQSKHERLATAKIAVSNLVRSADQQAQDTFRQADNTLKDLVERVEHDGVDGKQQARLAKLMASDLVNVEGIEGLFIYNAQGDWIVNSFSLNPKEENNSDRAYFIYHREHADDTIHIGPIIKSRSSGDMVIPISRRINTTDGTFAGVVLATVPVAYFQAFFERMDVDEKGVIFIALKNGDLLARRPTLTALRTTNLTKGDIFTRYLSRNDSGTAVIKSIVDGVERVYAYRRIAGLPIVVAAGISCDYVFTPWWTYAYRSMILVGIIILTLVFLSSLLYRQIQQLITAERELNVARHDLEIIAQTDSLTHLANRRCFDAALMKEWGRANRNASTIALILLDIDWFKQYNDHYGHPQGDECLKQVAGLVGKSVKRSTDLAARYGGEEFVILLPDTELAGALSVAEQVRSSIAEAHIKHLASPLANVTISAGVVAIMKPDKDRYAAALAEADRLLYCAKSKGRNSVVGECIQSISNVDDLAEVSSTHSYNTFSPNNH
jgi:diguanylate cyclase (GGDEF)-like protein